MVYYLLYATVYALSLLPMRLLYCLSDVAYVLVYHIMGYRKRVVRGNLMASFPDKSGGELRRIERDFYRWFCDYLVETVKLTTMGEEEMRRRMRFEGMEQVEALARQGKSMAFYLGHYCNWEWVSSFALHLPGCLCAQIYRPLDNKAMDRLFLKIRSRFGGHNIKKHETLQVIRHWQQQGQPNIVGFISDQLPASYASMHYWTLFLHQKTAFQTGTERIARLFSEPVFYIEMTRERRGYYVGRIIKLSDDARQEPLFHTTQLFVERLQQSITTAPAYWLWTHKRWKRTWEGFVKAYPEEKERERIMRKL